jgi:hypothetical protein
LVFCLGIIFAQMSIMKKSTAIQFLISMIALMITGSVMAQHGANGPTTPVNIGSVTLNVGVGVGANYKGDYYGTAFGTKVAAEWGLWQAGPGVVTLGPEVGVTTSSGGYPGYENYGATTWIIAGRGAWHYGWEVRGLDTYGGFSLGVGFHSYHYDNPSYTSNQTIPVFGAFLGGSYFISEGFGFNAEFGYDITYFQVGVIFKFQ